MGERFFRMVFLFGLFVFVLFFLAFAVKNAGDVFSGKSKSDITGKIIQKGEVREIIEDENAGNVLSGFAVHPLYTSFSLPERRLNYSESTGLISASDSIIYKYVYYSINGGSWQTAPLTGKYYGDDPNWMENTATTTIPALGAGEHYVIIYSCTYIITENSWDCHENKWQIIAINNTHSNAITITFESPTPNDDATVTTNTQTITAATTQNTGEDTSTWIDFDKTLIGYWSMDNYSNTGVYDGSTYQNFAKFEQELTISDITSGIRGKGIKLTTYNAECENSTWLTVESLIGTKAYENTGQLTYAVWIKPVTINWAGIMGTENVKLHTTTDNKIRITMYNPNTIQYTTTPIIIQNQWQHIAITYTKTTGNLTIYHNGNIIGTTTIQNANLADNPGYFFIGQNWWDCFNGTIDEAMTFNRTLNTQEIKALYNSKTNKFSTTITNLRNSQHDYNIYAIDNSGNTANTPARTFIVNAPVTASCTDGIKNQNEIYTDCGGNCPACECYSDYTENCDILNGIGTHTIICTDGHYTSTTICTLTSCNTGYHQEGNQCVPDSTTPTCNDGIQNGDETGTDCGGNCPACPSYLRTFYISSSTGSDSNTGTSTSSPWKTLNKVNSQTLRAGDAILFKRGDTWQGTLTISYSGTSSAPITYGAYGTGEKPIITGLTTITGWTNQGSGTYYKSISTQSSPKIVLVNGINTPKGRWPDTTWLLYDSYSGNTQITDNDLNGKNFNGGEFVTRINSWITYTAPISSHSGSTITFPWIYSTLGVDYSMKGGQGYFIQNDIDTFNIIGDWAYINGALYMYFGSNNPTNYQIKTSTIDKLAYINNKEHITFDNIIFEGANQYGIEIRNSRHITITNCKFRYIGGTGIHGPWDGDSSYMKVENSEFTENNNCGIRVQGDHEYATIRYNTLTNIGMIDGLADSIDGSAIGIMATGSNTLITNNNIDYTGYIGISFGQYSGTNSKVINNFVNHYCQKKDDGGGIYTYNDKSSGKQIINNIVLNGISHPEGLGGYLPDGLHENVYHDYNGAHGIYIDGSSNVLISGNTIANNQGSGIFVNTQALNINVQNNIAFNNLEGILIISNRNGGGEITGMTMLNNTFVAKDANQYTLYYATGSGDSAVRQLGIINNNYYARPIDDTKTIRTQTYIWSGPTVYRTLAEWQTYSGHDSNSKKSPKTITTTNDLRFEYNPTSTTKTISLGETYIDIKGTTYPGSITLQPYNSAILIKN